MFYRNQIGMSFPYKECGLVALTFFKTSFMKRINMHLSSPMYFLCFSDTVSEECEILCAFNKDHAAYALYITK